MKTLKIPYKELMWEIPWETVLRMLYDLPNQKYIEKETDNSGNSNDEVKELTPQTSNDFKKYLDKINQQNKK